MKVMGNLTLLSNLKWSKCYLCIVLSIVFAISKYYLCAAEYRKPLGIGHGSPLAHSLLHSWREITSLKTKGEMPALISRYLLQVHRPEPDYERFSERIQ